MLGRPKSSQTHCLRPGTGIDRRRPAPQTRSCRWGLQGACMLLRTHTKTLEKLATSGLQHPSSRTQDRKLTASAGTCRRQSHHRRQDHLHTSPWFPPERHRLSLPPQTCTGARTQTQIHSCLCPHTLLVIASTGLKCCLSTRPACEAFDPYLYFLSPMRISEIDKMTLM